MEEAGVSTQGMVLGRALHDDVLVQGFAARLEGEEFDLSSTKSKNTGRYYSSWCAYALQFRTLGMAGWGEGQVLLRQ